MLRLHRRVPTLVLAILIVSFLSITPRAATAAPPEDWSEVVDESFVVADVCAFPYTQTLVGTVRGTTRFDKQGNPIAEVVHIHLQGTFAANGVIVPFIIRSTEHVEINSDGSSVVTTSGIIGRAVVPGEGLVGATIGRARLTFPADGGDPIFEFLAGQENEAEFFGGTLCELLSP